MAKQHRPLIYPLTNGGCSGPHHLPGEGSTKRRKMRQKNSPVRHKPKYRAPRAALHIAMWAPRARCSLLLRMEAQGGGPHAHRDGV